MQHRLFVVRLRDDVALPEATDHWRRAHGALFARTPGLRGYLQNRPVDPTGWVCSETLFDDRRAETEAFRSTYYTDIVAPDEARFLDRESVRTAVVVYQRVEHGRIARFRAVLPGTEPGEVAGAGAGVQVYRLNRPLVPGTPAVVTFVWDDDPEVVSAVTRRRGGNGFASEPRVAALAGGGWPWADGLERLCGDKSIC